MALRSISPRFIGTLIGAAVLSACGTQPASLTTPSQTKTAFTTQQCAISPLVPFSYFGNPYGGLAGGLGYGGCGGFGAYGGLGYDGLGLIPCGVPFNDGAIGTALPFPPVPAPAPLIASVGPIIGQCGGPLLSFGLPWGGYFGTFPFGCGGGCGGGCGLGGYGCGIGAPPIGGAVVAPGQPAPVAEAPQPGRQSQSTAAAAPSEAGESD